MATRKKDDEPGAEQHPGADAVKTGKRLNLATNTMEAGVALWNAYQKLLQLKAQRPAAGNFTADGTDFENTAYPHLSGFLIGAVLDTLTTELDAWFNEAGEEHRKSYLLELIP